MSNSTPIDALTYFTDDLSNLPNDALEQGYQTLMQSKSLSKQDRRTLNALREEGKRRGLFEDDGEPRELAM